MRPWNSTRLAGRSGDGGFVLLESIVAITIITIIMAAVGAEFVSGLVTSSKQRAEQSAVQLADSAVERIRSLHPSDLVVGHDLTSVTSQFGGAPASVQPWLAQMDQAVDTTATTGTGLTAAVPTAGTAQQPQSIKYTVTDYLGWCYIRVTGSTDCVRKAALGAAASVTYLRAVVAVTWGGSRCASAGCSYVTSTLISTASDPTFQLNQPLPTAPVATDPGAQTVAVRDTVNLQLAAGSGTGVPPLTWSLTGGTLPTGLTLSPAGLISGTVGGSAGNLTSTLQVRDAFLRTDSRVVNWTVEPAVTLTAPGPQASTTTTAVNLALAATGGDGAPYSYAVVGSSLPPGLTMSTSGTITGTPTAVGNYTVNIKVFDATGTRFGLGTFTWTVTYPPIAASVPATQTSSVTAAIPGLQLSATGGSGGFAWSDASPATLPAGLSITSSGLITGTPTTVGTSTVALTVNDATAGYTKTVSFTWVVLAAPTVTAPATQSSSIGTPVNLGLATSCPNAPCRYALSANAPSGLTISNAGVITGTITAAQANYTGVTATITDAAGAVGTSSGFTWIVHAAPKLAGPSDQVTLRGAVVNLDVSTIASGGTGTYTYTATGLPSWLTLDRLSGHITGTAPTTDSITTGITVKLTDSTGAATTSAAFQWAVSSAVATTMTSQTTYSAGSVNLNMNSFASGGIAPYKFTATGLPGWLTLNRGTGALTGTAPAVAANSTTKTTGITLTVTDSVGSTVTSAPFTWYVSDLHWTTPPTVTLPQGYDMSPYNAASYVTGGGSGTRVYTATSVPTGIYLAPSGTITGACSTKGRWVINLAVTNSAGATAWSTITWTVY